MTRTFNVMNTMMLIARRSFFFTALQFVEITRYTVSLRLAKKKQQRTLNTTQLRILGLSNFLYERDDLRNLQINSWDQEAMDGPFDSRAFTEN